MNVFRKKSIDSILAESRNKTLNPTMKTMDLVLFGIGAIIGSGILVLTGKASAEAGPAVIFSFLIAGVLQSRQVVVHILIYMYQLVKL